MEPSRSNDYQIPSWPPTALTRDLWNAVFLDIALRLTARENLEADFEGLIEQGTQASLDYIQVNVGPQLAALQAAINDAQDRIEDIIVEGTAPNSAKLGGQLPAFYATAQALLDGLALKADDADFEARTRAVVAELTGNAPAALDTIYELAAAIGNDPNIRQTLLNAIALKVDKANPQMSGTATVSGNVPAIALRPTTGNNWNLDAFTEGKLRIVDATGNARVADFSTSGAFWTKELGDVKTYIDTKASAARDAAIAKGFGDGQTWQTVTRASNTVYQNATGKPIAISYYGNNAVLRVSPDGSAWTDLVQSSFTAGTFHVPPGHFYQWPSGTINFVRELR